MRKKIQGEYVPTTPRGADMRLEPKSLPLGSPTSLGDQVSIHAYISGDGAHLSKGNLRHLGLPNVTMGGLHSRSARHQVPFTLLWS